MVDISREEIDNIMQNLGFIRNILMGGVKGTSHPVHFQAAVNGLDKCLVTLRMYLRKGSKKIQ